MVYRLGAGASGIRRKCPSERNARLHRQNIQKKFSGTQWVGPSGRTPLTGIQMSRDRLNRGKGAVKKDRRSCNKNEKKSKTKSEPRGRTKTLEGWRYRGARGTRKHKTEAVGQRHPSSQSTTDDARYTVRREDDTEPRVCVCCPTKYIGCWKHKSTDPTPVMCRR